MTLQQAQRTPGYYGRLIEPWTPESNEPLLFRMVEVLTDGSIMEETMGDPLPLCPSSDLHDDWQPMEASLMLWRPRRLSDKRVYPRRGSHPRGYVPARSRC